MNSFKVKYENTEIKCTNLEFTNSTLISADIEGERISFFITNKQIARDIVKDKIILKSIYNRLTEEYTEFMTLIGN